MAARKTFLRQQFFSRVGDAPPALVSLLLLLAGDVETNPGPSRYACGQNFRQSDTPLVCLTPGYGIQPHKQTRCSSLPTSEQFLLRLALPTAG